MSNAERTADFVNSIGVNLHSYYSGTPYTNVSEDISELQYLGIDHIRDGNQGTTSSSTWQYQHVAELAAAGIKFDFAMPASNTVAADMTWLNMIEAAYPGSVFAVEGPNEITNTTVFSTGGTGYSAVPAYEQAVYNAVSSDPALAGVSIYSNTFPGSTNSSAVGQNISQYVTDSASHVYFEENPPEAGAAVPGQAAADAPDVPKVITETGYSTDPPAIYNPHGIVNVNDDVQAKYTLDLLFDDMKAGIQEVYLYELIDEKTESSSSANYGLFNFDGSAKPAAVALHNLTTILADNSATVNTFTTSNLNYTISGLPTNNHTTVDGDNLTNYGGNSFLMEKSNGAFDLCIWAEPALWNDTTNTEMVATPSLVTVTLAQVYQTIEVFDPTLSSSPVEVLHNVSSVQVIITDHPIIIEVEPSGVGSAAQAIPQSEVLQLEGVSANQIVADNASLKPFSSAAITDSETGVAITATLYVQTSNGQITDANGILSGPGVTKTGVGTYSITALSAAALSATLQGLVFTPTEYEVAPGQTVTTDFTIVMSDGTNTTTQSGSSVIATAQLTAPVIAGAGANQSFQELQTINPFAKTTIIDPDVGAAVSVNISVVNAGGSVTDVDGELSGAGLIKTGAGTYTLTADAPIALTKELDQLLFTPAAGQVAAGQSVLTSFDLAVSDGTNVTTNTTNSVIVKATGPEISGDLNLTSQDDDSPITVLKFMTVTDALSGGSETATITLLNSSGNPTDANGVLSGAGLSEISSGTYEISAASPAALTAALNALTFAPKNREVAPGQTVTTKFAVTVSDGVRFGTSTVATINVVAQGSIIAADGTLTLASGSSVRDTIYFGGSNAILSVGGTSLPEAAITGFDLNGSTGDEIVLTGFQYVAGKDTISLAANNVLNLNLNGSKEQLNLDPSAQYEGHGFSIGTNNQGQVVITDPTTTDTGPSYLFTNQPTSSVLETITEYSGPNLTGTQISNVVDNSNGTALIYAYNPTSTVTQTAQLWSGTNPANYVPVGSEISDVVDNADGTSLLYAYNPTSTVKQTAELWTETNSANGAPAGTEVSDVIDNTDGTSIVYAFNPSSTVTLTATYYSGADPTTGAPTGTPTQETFDYANGGSSITTGLQNGTGSTVYYTGPNGTGTVTTSAVAAAATEATTALPYVPAVVQDAPLTSAAPNPAVMLNGVTDLALTPMQFITTAGVAGGITITALAANQTLLGAPGDTLVGSAAYSDLFKGTAASMNYDLFKNFGGSDQIDLTDILASKVTGITWRAVTGGGVLSISDGTHSTALTIQGNYASNSFTFKTDGANGTLISYS